MLPNMVLRMPRASNGPWTQEVEVLVKGREQDANPPVRALQAIGSTSR